MKGLRTALEEVIGLFVEDGSLAIGILVWVALAAWVFPLFGKSGPWAAPVLFAGLIIILLENVWRSSKKRRS